LKESKLVGVIEMLDGDVLEGWIVKLIEENVDIFDRSTVRTLIIEENAF
jgi:hypothetical protein